VSVVDVIDTQPPLLFITTPYQNQIVSGMVSVSGTASDDWVVRRVEARISPGEWEVADGTTAWGWEWNTTQDLNGRYRVEARAWDGFNYSSLATVEVEVTNDDANRRPTVRLTADPLDVPVGEPVSFSGNSSSDDSGITAYSFDFGDGETTGWGSQSWVLHTFTTPGSYVTTLEVEDDEGARSSAPASVTVTVLEQALNSAPQALIALPLSGTQLTEGAPITLSAAGSSDPDGDQLLFVWSSDRDGLLTTTTETSVEVQLTPGAHTLTLAARDPAGAIGEATVQITVQSLQRDDDSLIPAPTGWMVMVVLAGVTLLAARRVQSRRG
ncbi:MAG: PKD domain-containing protein, partial [Candidatus Thermoplasmatota archaeon]|nr:PKD domain-containing protein [Candidatus Thermoplasmatota archaeon]